MVKQKPSASSATRKKHARKAAVAHGEPQDPAVPKEKKPKGKEKGKKNKEPRKKVYIAPVKPAPAQPDPLDTLGIAQRIPAEFLVVLRLLAKKDSVTKRRALEDLQADWVDKVRREKDEVLLHVLAEVMPVWVRRDHNVCFAYSDIRRQRRYTISPRSFCIHRAASGSSQWACTRHCSSYPILSLRSSSSR